MISSDKNVVVGASACSQAPCVTSCASSECRLCKPCMSKQDINELHNAFREHVNRGENKRIFPVPMVSCFTNFSRVFQLNISFCFRQSLPPLRMSST